MRPRSASPKSAPLLQPAQAEAIITKAGLKTAGSVSALQTLASVMDTFDPNFNICTP